MKANVKGLKGLKGLAIALLAPFVLGQCSDSQAVVEQTSMPGVFDDVAVKRAPTQRIVEFYLTSEYLDAEWKVYPSKTGQKLAANMTASCNNGTMLVLMHSKDIIPATYYVSATDPGKSESERVPLTVLNQEQTDTPETSIAIVAKSTEAQARVTFTLDNAGVYSALSEWRLYMLPGEESTTLVPGVTATLSGEILTLTHTSNLPEREYWVAVTDMGKSESKRKGLSITPYEKGRTPAPLPENATVAKSAEKQASVSFLMLNAYSNPVPVWKLYSSAVGNVLIDNVSMSYSDKTLTLSHTSDIPVGAYFVAVTDGELFESARVKLTVSNYVLPATATPTVAITNFAKTAFVQASANFTLTNDFTYPATTTWKVYAAATGPVPAINITPTHNNNILTLTHTSDILARDYWVTATEAGKTESERLQLTITAYEQGKTPTPTVASSGIIKTAGMQPTVSFTLTNDFTYPATTTWKVYSATTGTAVVSGVTASSAGAVLTLRHATNVPERTYYITATEQDKSESMPRLALTVAKDRTPTPNIAPAVVAKTNLTQPSVNFTLVNDDLSEFPPNTIWTLYGDVDKPLVEVSVTINRTASGTLLTLTRTPNITARDYWLTATIPGKIESERVQLTVVDYDPDRTPTPTTTPTNASVAKTTLVQANVVFTLSNIPDYRPNTVWKVYREASGTTLASGMSAEHSGALLTLTSTGGDVQFKTYYVTATEGNLTESLRLPLTVVAFAPPIIGQTPTPVVYIPSLSKTALQQPSIDFTLNNASAYSLATCTWRVYSSQTSTTEMSSVSASLLYGSILKLTHSSDIPVDSYWITAQELDKSESERRRLTVAAFMLGTTPTPDFDLLFQKPPTAVPSVSISLFNAADYSDMTEWRVYSTAIEAGLDNNITASLSGTSLVLESSTGNVMAKDYWITATNTPNVESARQKLTVENAPQTQTPMLQSATFVKPPAQPLVPNITVQMLNNNPPYSHSSTWNVYDVEFGGAPITYLIPTFNVTDSELSIASTAGDVPAQSYWITAQEPLESESARQKFTVTSPRTQTPETEFTSYELSQEGGNPASVTVKMLNNPPYSSNCVWKIYTEENNTIILDALVTSTSTFDAATHELVLTNVNNNQESSKDYFITAQEPLEDESGRSRGITVTYHKGDVMTNLFSSAVGDHMLTIVTDVDPLITNGIFALQANLNLSQFTVEGTPGFTNLTGGTVTRIDDHTVTITGLTPVTSAGVQKIYMAPAAFIIKPPTVAIGSTQKTTVYAGGGNGFQPIESGVFSSNVGNHTLTITLGGVSIFVPQEYLALSQFPISTPGTGGFTSMTGGTVTRVSDKVVTITGLPPVTIAGSGQKISVASSAFASHLASDGAVSAVASGLAALQVYLTETKTVTGIGPVWADDNTRTPLWSVRGGNASIEAAPTAFSSYPKGGYLNNQLTLTGLAAGKTTYAVRTMQDGSLVDTEGPLEVIANTTWYVEQGAPGKHGFTLDDKIPLSSGRLDSINKFYSGEWGYAWPGKGSSAEQHAVIRFTGNEPAAINLQPKYVDLVNNSPTGTVTIGRVTVGTGKDLTLEGVELNGLDVGDYSAVTMKQDRTRIKSASHVAGEFIMEGGTVNAVMTMTTTSRITVKGGTFNSGAQVSGEFILEGGTVNGNIPAVYGKFTMTGGTFNSQAPIVRTDGKFTVTGGIVSSPKMTVEARGEVTISGNGTLNCAQTIVNWGGKLTINRRANIGSALKIYYQNGRDVTPDWGAVSFPWTFVPTAP